jgi:hypothetical protein
MSPTIVTLKKDYGKLLSKLHLLQFEGRYDTQQNDIEHNDTQHKGLIWDTQNNKTVIMLSVVFFKAECHYAKCRIFLLLC